MGFLDEIMGWTSDAFTQEMAKDPTMQEMRKCSEMMSGEMMQGMMQRRLLWIRIKMIAIIVFVNSRNIYRPL
jgi:hypothetical protein